MLENYLFRPLSNAVDSIIFNCVRQIFQIMKRCRAKKPRHTKYRELEHKMYMYVSISFLCMFCSVFITYDATRKSFEKAPNGVSKH
jgi:hypothetical protein